MSKFISFAELVHGRENKVRVTDDNLIYVSDLAMVLTGKTRDNAGHALREVPDDVFDSTKYIERQIGSGHKTKLLTIEDSLELVMVLPGKMAQGFRIKFSKILVRFLAGDHTLIDEIRSNAASDSPVAQIARASLSQVNLLDDSHKRKREELEIMKLETEIHCMERNSRMAVIDKYGDLCANSAIDERAKIMLKDWLLNSTSSSRAITNGEEAPSFSLSEVSHDLGFKFSTEQLAMVGRTVAKLYKERYGPDVVPSKHWQIVNGRATEVNTYFAKDKDLIERALNEFKTEEDRKANTGQKRLDQWVSRA